jgi:ATP-binding cassette subfamily B protein/ATP-binding cassette subfamily C protein
METKKTNKVSSTINVIKKELKLLGNKKYRKYIPLLIFNCIFGAILPLALVYFPKYVISQITSSSSFQEITITIIIFSIICVVSAVITTFIAAKDTHVYMELRFDQFDLFNIKLKEIDYSYLEDPDFRDKSNTALTALSNNISGFEGIFHNFHNMLPIILQILVFSVLICIFNYTILLVLIIGVIVSALVNKAIVKYLEKTKDARSRAIRQKNYYYNTLYDFAYGKDIRVYDLKNRLSNEYKRKSHSYISVVKNITNKQFSLGLLELITLLLQDGLSYFLIVYSYYQHQIDLSQVALYVGIVIALSTAFRNISQLIYDISSCAEYSKDYFQFMEDKTFYSHKGTLKALSKENTLEIEFKNVSFKYPKTDRYILKDFNFKIEKGMRLAIVGTNGAGKTTIIKLITSLFDVSEGRIEVNGININEFDINEYQQMFGVVFQDINIYAGSILENVIGKVDETSDINRAKECLKEVGLEEKILGLPNKYDTQLLKVLDEEGTELSGGQNQKLVIARALYKNANMIILDEPTSALDALTEAKIYEDFDKLIKNKTAIYVSHRLSSTKFCDKIALFDNDGLKEYGTHDELMKLNGEYANMFTIQGKYYQESKEI